MPSNGFAHRTEVFSHAYRCARRYADAIKKLIENMPMQNRYPDALLMVVS